MFLYKAQILDIFKVGNDFKQSQKSNLTTKADTFENKKFIKSLVSK